MSVTYLSIIDEGRLVSRVNPSAWIKYNVPMSAAETFCAQQIGGLVTQFGIDTFQVPAKHPRCNLYAKEATYEPLGDYNAEVGDWLNAAVTVNYGQWDQPSQADGTEIADISYEQCTEELSLASQRSKFKYKVGNTLMALPDDFVPIKTVASVVLSLNFKFKPNVDPSIWNSTSDHVNDSTFFGWDAGKVLLCNPNAHRTVATSGNDQWSYSYKFWIRPNGWNYIWAPSSGGSFDWREIIPHIYLDADFSTLGLGVGERATSS